MSSISCSLLFNKVESLYIKYIFYSEIQTVIYNIVSLDEKITE
jgi:hypothetical protein